MNRTCASFHCLGVMGGDDGGLALRKTGEEVRESTLPFVFVTAAASIDLMPLETRRLDTFWRGFRDGMALGEQMVKEWHETLEGAK